MEGEGQKVELKQGSQSVSAMSNLLLTLKTVAFAFHTVCDQVSVLWKKARSRISKRRRFFTTLMALNDCIYFTQLGTTADAVRTDAALPPTTAGCRTRTPSLNLYRRRTRIGV